MGFLDIFKIKRFKIEIEQLKKENEAIRQQLQESGAFDYYQIKDMTNQLEQDFQSRQAEFQEMIDKTNDLILQEEKLNKNIKTQTNKLARSKELVKAMNYALDKYSKYVPDMQDIRFPETQMSEIEEISPSVILKLQCMNVKDLRKAYKENDKQIDLVLQKYSARYTTKTNRAIYKLMVLALRSELQNILYNLKFEKLDTSIEAIKKLTEKFQKVAVDGNQSIAGTLRMFIAEMEYLFTNAAKIEYNYYVKKEQARQEQLAIKEQMRQEAEERKALEAERKKVEREESKYKAEIEKIQEQLSSAKDEKLEQLNARILELQAQLSDVAVRKAEISTLANGKAGNVYIISNLGSFGENVFKVGMTRRLNPQDRVNELGDASVPFKFDVHSFIFSDDAVGLENKLHNILNEKRVNKVNLRKEFFNTSIDELEEIVTNIEPTAEFNKTMLAEEFRQSISSDKLYTSDIDIEDYEED